MLTLLFLIADVFFLWIVGLIAVLGVLAVHTLLSEVRKCIASK